MRPRIGEVAPGAERIAREVDRMRPRIGEVAPGAGRIAREVDRMRPRIGEVAPGVGRIAREVDRMRPRIGGVVSGTRTSRCTERSPASREVGDTRCARRPDFLLSRPRCRSTPRPEGARGTATGHGHPAPGQPRSPDGEGRRWGGVQTQRPCRPSASRTTPATSRPVPSSRHGRPWPPGAGTPGGPHAAGVSPGRPTSARPWRRRAGPCCRAAPGRPGPAGPPCRASPRPC